MRKGCLLYSCIATIANPTRTSTPSRTASTKSMCKSMYLVALVVCLVVCWQMRDPLAAGSAVRPSALSRISLSPDLARSLDQPASMFHTTLMNTGVSVVCGESILITSDYCKWPVQHWYGLRFRPCAGRLPTGVSRPAIAHGSPASSLLPLFSCQRLQLAFKFSAQHHVMRQRCRCRQQTAGMHNAPRLIFGLFIS